MPLSAAKKKANAKWDRANMAVIACKLKAEQAAKFKEYCSNQGKATNAVLKDFVLSCIGEDDKAGALNPPRH